MAIRVTESEVREIIELDDSIVLDPFIKVASSFVDKIEAGDELGLLIPDDLKEVERWLAAHFSAIRDMRVSKEKAGSVEQSFQFELDVGFEVTMYGQMAKRLDITGYLAAIDRKASSECNKCTEDAGSDYYVCMEAL